MNPEIVRYIEEHREVYTREAIDRNLREAGYDPAEMAEAWRSIEASATKREVSRRFWVVFLIYIAGLYGMTFVLSDYWLEVRASLGEALNSGTLWIVSMSLLIAAVVSILLVWGSRKAAFAAVNVFLVAILVPFVFVVVISGLCLSISD